MVQLKYVVRCHSLLLYAVLYVLQYTLLYVL